MMHYYATLYQHFVDNLLIKYPEAICQTHKSTKTKRGIVYLPSPGGPLVNIAYGTIQKKTKAIVLMSYPRWKRALESLCMNGRIQAIEEGVLNLGMCMGHIRIYRIERNYARKRVNYAATSKQPKVLKDGKMVPENIIYYTDDFYPRIQHVKARQIPNETSYKFKPSKGNGPGRGFIRHMNMAITAKPTLLLKYQTKYYIKKCLSQQFLQPAL